MPQTASPAPETAGSAGDSDIFFVAVSATRMPMLVTDPNLPDNPIVFANEAFCELTGYPPGELVGRNCRFLQGRDTDRATVAIVRDALERRANISVELLNYRKDGTPFWNAVFISPVFAPDGRLRYFFASQIDVTARRDAERALEQAQRLEGLGSLAGGVAHEFNNLLTVIQGNLEPLLRDAATPRTARRLERLRDAAERATVLTRSMISFARRQRLQDQPIDLGRALIDLGPVLEQVAGPENRLVLDREPERAEIRADPEQLRTALLNIVLNAREAMPQGGTVTIETSTRRNQLGQPTEIALMIRDEGCGMSPAVARRAMDPFFTTKPAGAGTGLGLSMAYGFMRQTGGRIELDSHPGEGTTVRMIFPRPDGAKGGLPAAKPGEKVLIVDDDFGLREDAAAILRGLGYGVLTAASPATALQALSEHPDVHAMITDVAMPGMTGPDLIERARAIRPGLPVLLTTRLPDGETALVLVKPYTSSALASRLRELLDTPRGSPPAPAGAGG